MNTSNFSRKLQNINIWGVPKFRLYRTGALAKKIFCLLVHPWNVCWLSEASVVLFGTIWNTSFDRYFKICFKQFLDLFCFAPPQLVSINLLWTPRVFFNAKFLLDGFDFSSDFYALDFLRFARSKIFSQSQFQAAKLNWRQFNTKSQMKIAPKLVPFFTLNLNSGII